METCPVPMRMVGVMDRFGKSGKPDELLKKYGLTPDNIVEKVKDVLKNK
ncbi:transketolase [Acetivibrio straminisolvens JCM 21531]|uniref:Transketolase n=1 Tax=Acetivibrio straminisolvens JCM 21531 TaxID=1294263 RepID=W4V3Q8_9FIRM|nr:transketolase [Acetivibrio straminisolvens JCM 21531]